LTFGRGIGAGSPISWLKTNAWILLFVKAVFRIEVIISFGIFLSFFQLFRTSSPFLASNNRITFPSIFISAIFGSYFETNPKVNFNPF
jgi:hypothetical protein